MLIVQTMYERLLMQQFGWLLFVFAQKEQFNVRLTPSSSLNTGRLEVQRVTNNGNLSRWGAVCDNTFGDKEAQVVCRQLGYSFGRAEKQVYRDRHSQFVLDKVTCSGNETELSECSHSGWLKHHCVSNKDFCAGVCCSNETSFGGYINGTYISHCRKTWIDSAATCLKIGRHLYEGSFLGMESVNTTYWSNHIYTPWIALNGCYKRPHNVLSTIELFLNSPGVCVQLCMMDGDVIFGLSGPLCYCLKNVSMDKKETGKCGMKCQGDGRQSCGNGVDLMSVYTTVPKDMFVQYTAPSSETQCALLQNHNLQGLEKKRLKSENCGNNHSYLCEYYTSGARASYIPSGGRKANVTGSREECSRQSLSLAGWGAVDAKKDIFFIHSSWIDISRYRVSYIQQNGSSLQVEPEYCVVTSTNETAKDSESIVGCKTRHLFICEKDDRPEIQRSSIIYLSTTPLTNNLTIVPNGSSEPTTLATLDTEALTTIISVSCSSLIALVLCLACVCLCRKRWENLSSKQSVCSGSNIDTMGSEILSDQSERELKQVYSNTYDTIRESHVYSQIIQEDGEGRVADCQELQNSPDLERPYISFDSVTDEHDCSEPTEGFKLNENYVEPSDSIQMRKIKVKSVKSSASYTLPYDCLSKSLQIERKL